MYKKRKRSGRYYPRLSGKDNLNWLREECLLPQQAWDDWKDHRDGIRHDRDKTHIRFPFMTFADPQEIRKENEKLKRWEKIRRYRKEKRKPLSKEEFFLTLRSLRKARALYAEEAHKMPTAMHIMNAALPMKMKRHEGGRRHNE